MENKKKKTKIVIIVLVVAIILLAGGITISYLTSAKYVAKKAVKLMSENAVELAKKYVTVAIEHSLSIGKGNGPTNHFYELYKRT